MMPNADLSSQTERQKAYARAAVRRAIVRGDLTRPANCGRCARPDAKRSDGRSAIHAHHHKGYDHPLDVEWLCPKCHFSDDKRPARQANGRAKLTEAQVADIRARYRRGINRHRSDNAAGQLAREYGVAATTITRIIAGEMWIDAALAEGV